LQGMQPFKNIGIRRSEQTRRTYFKP
jgi:hypothetical protein